MESLRKNSKESKCGGGGSSGWGRASAGGRVCQCVCVGRRYGTQSEQQMEGQNVYFLAIFWAGLELSGLPPPSMPHVPYSLRI